jgi:hypothetical protein
MPDLPLAGRNREVRPPITVELVTSGRVNDRVLWPQTRELGPAHLPAGTAERPIRAAPAITCATSEGTDRRFRRARQR